MMLQPLDALWMGFDGRDAEAVDTALRPGGIVLFAKNLDSDPSVGPRRCRALVEGLRERWRPLAVALDQEGGAVSRLKAWVGPTPGLHDVWQQGGAGACEAWGRLWGEGLRLLGIQVDFAPVADLHDGHQGTGMLSRCASSEPLETTRAAGAFLHGLESTGTRGCLKHFPGLGGTRVDSHRELPEILDAAQLARNRRPFEMLVHADRLVMAAHVRTGDTEGLPASLHRASLNLRARWIPDALEMGGCAAWDWETRLRLALEAGHEALLVCQPLDAVQQAATALQTLPEALWKPAAEAFLALRRAVDHPLDPWSDGAWFEWVSRVQQAAAVLGTGAPQHDPTDGSAFKA